ncbi:sigma-B regulation protein RsbU (phosphoserine phosphatase) [Acidipila rosea]|uniref:Sigma-B regulation protein RsbU (Phosphoserine phosphatase) n=2 Tax=Acidipila rosea TaxID=768535 RepID=A0A4R1L7L9_9BACT|nr:sigma-B regulation protein RsbU (phosphoserine phosphatase) [Acidipila rosea]
MVAIPMKKKRRDSPNLLRALLGLYVLVSLSFWVSSFVTAWELNFHADRHVQEPFRIDARTNLTKEVNPMALAAGIPAGAKVIGINGADYSGREQWQSLMATARPGDGIDVDLILPTGNRKTVSLTLKTLPFENPHTSRAILFMRESLISGLLPLVCLLIGYWVVLAKPTMGNAWLLLVLLTFPSVIFQPDGLFSGATLLLHLTWFQLQLLLSAPALLLFGIYFPERSRIDVKLPWLKWLILGAQGIGLLIILPYEYQVYVGGGPGPLLGELGARAGQVFNYLDLVCVLLYLVLTLDKLRSASTPDARRRLRVLNTGMGIGIGSLLIVFILLPSLGVPIESSKYYWLSYTSAVLFMVAPLTLSYVVLVQRALDVRVLLQMGARYMLAKWTLYVLERVVLIVAAFKLVGPIFGKKQPHFSDFIGLLIFLGLIFSLRLGVRKRLQSWLDRRFFRESYNAERVLQELSYEVRRFTETEPLLETVARCVSETLHVDQIAMLLRRGEFFQMQQSIGIDASGVLTLPAQSSAVRYMTNSNEPALLYRDDPDAWYLMAGNAERQTLERVNAELLLPLPGRNRMMGLMALGPKRSQAAYSRADLNLLQALASQTGLALEVSELAHSLAAEAAQRERANREMEIAREVQERLFPQEMPTIPGATIAGHCRPAQGVGGDYYDVFHLGEGRVGLAVGDVSGKGISAALLMASLRASLRGITLDNPRDYATLMHKVNRLVFEASASNRYATFFFAVYDPATRRLDCVNAGHNPPLLVRGDAVMRLQADGPVVGLLPFAPYTEQTMQLAAGDLLVCYTDGISEAMTHEEEEWGEERMIGAALCMQQGSAQAVLDCILAEADRFTAGAPQHDDMTLLVLKLDA